MCVVILTRLDRTTAQKRLSRVPKRKGLMILLKGDSIFEASFRFPLSLCLPGIKVGINMVQVSVYVLV